MTEESTGIIEEHVDLNLGLVTVEDRKATLIQRSTHQLEMMNRTSSTTMTTISILPPRRIELHQRRRRKFKLEIQRSIIEEAKVLKAHSKYEQKQTVSEAHVLDAELSTASLTEAMLTQASDLASALQLNKVGDAASYSIRNRHNL